MIRRPSALALLGMLSVSLGGLSGARGPTYRDPMRDPYPEPPAPPPEPRGEPIPEGKGPRRLTRRERKAMRGAP